MLVAFGPISMFLCVLGAVLVLLGGHIKLLVSLEVKVNEQENEREHVADLEVCPSYWESTGPYYCTHGVGHSEEELD